MSDSNVIKLAQPEAFSDSLTEILRSGARALLTQAIEAEVAEFLAKHADLKTATGPTARRAPRPSSGARDHDRDRPGRRSPAAGARPRSYRGRAHPVFAIDRAAVRAAVESLEVLIPILYLKGISTGDFEEALAALVGKEAPGLSASTIARLKEAWTEEHSHWQKRDLSAKRYLYFWADGIHLEARLEEQPQCILVIIGATPEGRKELVGFTDGICESSQSWRDLLLDLKRRD